MTPPLFDVATLRASGAFVSYDYAARSFVIEVAAGVPPPSREEALEMCEVFDPGCLRVTVLVGETAQGWERGVLPVGKDGTDVVH